MRSRTFVANPPAGACVATTSSAPDQNVASIRRAELNLVYRLTRRSGPTPVGTVDSAQAEVLVQSSAQYVPQVGHTHTRCRRLVVQVHDTERSAGRPGPSMVQRCPFGQPGGGIRRGLVRRTRSRLVHEVPGQERRPGAASSRSRQRFTAAKRRLRYTRIPRPAAERSATELVRVSTHRS